MGESMARDAIEMGLDLTVGPDGRFWEESSYNRPAINREIWGEGDYRHDKNKLDLYSEDDFYHDDEEYEDESYQDCEIEIIKISGTNYYFFDDITNALSFSSKYYPSIFNILDKNLGYLVYTELQNISEHTSESDENIGLLRLAKPMKDTVKNTLELLNQNNSIMKIADKRDLAVSTIINHIEELNRDYNIRFLHIKPSDEIVQQVKNAYRIIIDRNNPFDFLADGRIKLKPIFDMSGIDYEQIRLSLIFI